PSTRGSAWWWAGARARSTSQERSRARSSSCAPTGSSPSRSAWWVGDVIGDLVVAPVLLAWASNPRMSRDPRRILEGAALGAGLFGGALAVFRSAPGAEQTAFGHAYALFPLLIWAAVRFGQRGATSTTFLTSVVAIGSTG